MKNKNVVASTTETINSYSKLYRLLSKISKRPDCNGYYGIADIEAYLDEVWRYRAHEDYGFLRKMQSNKYETSEDLPAMAWIIANRDAYNIPLVPKDRDDVWSCFIPSSSSGINIWNKTVLLASKDNRNDPDYLYDLLIGEDAKMSFSESDQYHFSKLAYDRMQQEKNGATYDDANDIEFETKFKAVDPDVYGDEYDEAMIINSPITSSFVKDVQETILLLETLEAVEEVSKPTEEVVDLADKEHPEDDKPITEEVDKPIFGNIGNLILPKEQMLTFGEAMKDLIIFNDEKDVKENAIKPNFGLEILFGYEYAMQSANLENIYEPLKQITDFANNNGLVVYYNGWNIPAGTVIIASFYTFETKMFVRNLMIDPNVIFRNGYNVLTMTHNCDILAEDLCNIKDTDTIMQMIANNLTKKDQKKLRGRYPYGYKNVMEMVDFTNLGQKEPLSVTEWKKLIMNLQAIIKYDEHDNWKYRARLIEYISHDKFKLIVDDNVLPLLPELPVGMGKDYAEITKLPDDDGLWIEFDLQKYGEDKKYEFGVIPAIEIAS